MSTVTPEDERPLSAEALAAIPEITAWLETQMPTLRYKTARDGVGVACVLLKRQIDSEDGGE